MEDCEGPWTGIKPTIQRASICPAFVFWGFSEDNQTRPVGVRKGLRPLFVSGRALGVIVGVGGGRKDEGGFREEGGGRDVEARAISGGLKGLFWRLAAGGSAILNVLRLNEACLCGI